MSEPVIEQPVEAVEAPQDGPVAILDTDFKLVKRYPEASDARKDIRGLAHGTYHIVRFLNEGVVVGPKAAIVTNTVDFGTTFIKRAPSTKPRKPRAATKAKATPK